MRISIVIPCYDLGEFLPEAVRSAKDVDYDDKEIVIVDDGSTDMKTLAVLRDLNVATRRSVPLKIIRRKQGGVSAARNTGIREAQGRYILPLDADDRLRPDFPGRAAAVLDDNADVGVVYGSVQRFGESSERWDFPDVDPAGLLVANCVPVCALFRRQVWLDCGGYDENIESHEDWELWINALKHGWAFHRLPQVICDYRNRGDSMVSRWNKPGVRGDVTRYLCRKHRELYVRSLPEVLALKELYILELSKVLESRETSLRSHSALMRQQQRELEEHGRALRERIDFIEEVTKAFRRLEAELQETRGRLDAREAELRAIHATRWWKLASLLARLAGR